MRVRPRSVLQTRCADIRIGACSLPCAVPPRSDRVAVGVIHHWTNGVVNSLTSFASVAVRLAEGAVRSFCAPNIVLRAHTYATRGHALAEGPDTACQPSNNQLVNCPRQWTAPADYVVGFADTRRVAWHHANVARRASAAPTGAKMTFARPRRAHLPSIY